MSCSKSWIACHKLEYSSFFSSIETNGLIINNAISRGVIIRGYEKIDTSDYLYNAISDTARYGGLKSGNYLIDDEYENKLKNILSDIKNGKFVKDLEANFDTLKYKSSIDSKSSDQISKIMNVLFKKNKN